MLAWSRTNQILLNEEGFEAENQTIGNALVGSVSNCWSEATATCLDPKQCLRDRQAAADRTAGPAPGRRSRGVRHVQAEALFGPLERDGHVGEEVRRGRRHRGPDSHGTLHHHRLTTRHGRSNRTSSPRLPCEQLRIPDVRGDLEGLRVGGLSPTSSEYGDCTDTTTEQGQVAGDGAVGDRHQRRARPAIVQRRIAHRRAPWAPRHWASSRQDFDGHHVECSGDEEDVSGSRDRRGELDGLAVQRRGSGIPLERTDPTIPWTSDGAARRPGAIRPDRRDGTPIVITRHVDWKLTLEPDWAVGVARQRPEASAFPCPLYLPAARRHVRRVPLGTGLDWHLRPSVPESAPMGIPATGEPAAGGVAPTRAPGPTAWNPFWFLTEFRRDPLGFVARLQRDHGDVVRLGRGPLENYVIFHPTDIRRVLQDNNQNYEKGAIIARTKILIGEGLFTSEGDFWRRQRRLAQPAFHHRRIAGFIGTMADAAEGMLGAGRARRPRRRLRPGGRDEPRHAGGRRPHALLARSRRRSRHRGRGAARSPRPTRTGARRSICRSPLFVPTTSNRAIQERAPHARPRRLRHHRGAAPRADERTTTCSAC